MVVMLCGVDRQGAQMVLVCHSQAVVLLGECQLQLSFHCFEMRLKLFSTHCQVGQQVGKQVALRISHLSQADSPFDDCLFVPARKGI